MLISISLITFDKEVAVFEAFQSFTFFKSSFVFHSLFFIFPPLDFHIIIAFFSVNVADFKFIDLNFNYFSAYKESFTFYF
jgi:hypothetical protein